MPLVPDTSWWGWGSRDETFRFPAPSALWKSLSDELALSSAGPAIRSPDVLEFGSCMDAPFV